MSRLDNANDYVCYEIRILGGLQEGWLDWFNGENLTREENPFGVLVTSFQVRVPDQAGLRGILNKIWDLNLTLLSVDCTEVLGEKSDPGGK